jgi:hypothetical protein
MDRRPTPADEAAASEFEQSMNAHRQKLQEKCTHLWVISEGDSWAPPSGAHSRGFTCYRCQLYRKNPDFIPPVPTQYQ